MTSSNSTNVSRMKQKAAAKVERADGVFTREGVAVRSAVTVRKKKFTTYTTRTQNDECETKGLSPVTVTYAGYYSAVVGGVPVPKKELVKKKTDPLELYWSNYVGVEFETMVAMNVSRYFRDDLYSEGGY